MNIVLIGLRGTGKSTVGRLLATLLKWHFLDTDNLVQERAGMTIQELFSSKGEPEFRKLESELIQECVAYDKAIIATGGGAILDPKNVSVLKYNGFVVHLTASPRQLWHRISLDKLSHDTRPLLVKEAESGVDELNRLMLSRAAAYAHARDAEVSVEDRTPEEAAEAIIILMRAHGALAGAAGR